MAATITKATQKLERFPALGVFAPPPIAVDSPEFSGPLGQLLQMVSEHKVDLMRVPLLPVCQAYFEYLLKTNLSDLDEAAAALLALAYLLERKSWQLLPTPEEQPELEESLAFLDPTVAEYLPAIEVLKVWREEREQLFFRPQDAGPNPYEVPFELEDVSSLDLARALERILRKANPEPVRPTRAHRSLQEQMVVVLRALSAEWKPMENLLPESFTREDAVFWFLSLLELIRLGQAQVRLKDEDVQFRSR
ncbi:MAG: segregation/condensation protein A [Fimbriimonadaceae bacterium]